MSRVVRACLAAVLAGVALLVMAAPASAHVVPSTVIELDVHAADITASLSLPATDLATASGIAVASPVPAETTAAVTAYLEKHFSVSSADGTWAVSVSDIGTQQVEQWGTGTFVAVTATATLTPPDAADLRTFTLDYDAILHQVVTADAFVVLRRDWAAGQVETTRSLGAISVDTVTGQVPHLTVDLDDGSAWRGFTSMVRLGMAHIADGTDHQLFLLTLLLPAPLVAVRRRWRGVAPTGSAVRRITAITAAFTVGHSLTLAAGTLGLHVPQQPVEALIAVSILVAAVHAVLPVFPGREPVIAGAFGLVHGLAFSSTLSALHLSGAQLVLSLLGFNLGIEILQLAIVVIVLPPLLVLARTPGFPSLRVVAAGLTAVAAGGWLLDRAGVPNAVGTSPDAFGAVAPWVVLAVWVGAGVSTVSHRRASGIIA